MPIKRTTLAEKQAAMRRRQQPRPGRVPNARKPVSELDPTLAERGRIRLHCWLLLEGGRSPVEVALELNRVYGKRVEPAKIIDWYANGAKLAA